MTSQPPHADISFFALPKPPPEKWFRSIGLDDDGYRRHVAGMLPALNLIYMCLQPNANDFDRKAGSTAMEVVVGDQVSSWVTCGWLANMAAQKLPTIDADKIWRFTYTRMPRSFRDELGSALEGVVDAAEHVLDDVRRHRIHQPIKDWGTVGVLSMIALLSEAWCYAEGWLSPEFDAPLYPQTRMGRNP